MASGRAVTIVSVLALLALGAGVWYWQQQTTRAPVAASAPQAGQPGGAAAGQAKPEAEGPPPVAVELASVSSGAMPEVLDAVGTLRSAEAVVVRPEVSGRIATIAFREGAQVKRGTVLVGLDDSIARAELQQARANLTLAEADLKRSTDLAARGFVSAAARDDAVAKREVARAARALAEARLAKTQLRAPFSGVAGTRNVSIGDYVREGDALFNLEDIASLKVDFRLPEIHFSRLRRGQAIDIRSDALPDESFAARVAAIDPVVDAAGRAVLLRAELQNPGLRLRPGMFVRVRLQLAEREGVLRVPEQALVPGTQNTVYVYRVAEGVARRAPVSIGARQNGMAEIIDGLAEGDVIVAAGQQKLRDGARVRDVSAAPPADG